MADALRARRTGEVVGVLVIRLDQTRRLADAYGLGRVDELAAELAERLQAIIRADDVLLAGDGAYHGLCLVARGMPGQRDVSFLAERVVVAARRPVALAGSVDHLVTVSVGAATGLDDDPPAAVLARAERRCRRVAATGGDRWAGDPAGIDAMATNRMAAHPMAVEPLALDGDGDDRSVRAEALARLREAGELRRALDADQLDLAFTPLRLDGSGDGFGDRFGGDEDGFSGAWFEASVRWRHPVRGLLHAAAVVPAVLDAGLARPYLDTASRLAAVAAVDASVVAGRPVGVTLDLPLAVATQIRRQGGDPARIVADAVARARLAPARLALRILLDDARSGAEELAPIMDHLARLSIGSVVAGVDPSPGTLAWLATAPRAAVWVLDRAVADALLAAHDDRTPDAPAAPVAQAAALARAGVAAVVEAATARGIAVGADGVDHDTVAAELTAAGVRLLQGRWIGRPRPAAAVA